MSFLNDFESKEEGVNDTIEFVVRVAIVTLAAVILVVVLALAVGLFVPNEMVDSTAILETINPAFQTVIGAFVGLLGGLSLNANARDKEEPLELDAPEPEAPAPAGLPVVPYIEPEAPTPDPEVGEFKPVPLVRPVYPVVEDDDDDDDMAEYEKYRNDLRYDVNGDGVVSDDEMPNWRNPAA